MNCELEMTNTFKKQYGNDTTLSVFYGHIAHKLIDVTSKAVSLYFKDEYLNISKTVAFNSVFGDPCVKIPKTLIVRDGPQIYSYREGRQENIKIKVNCLNDTKYNFINYQRRQSPIDLVYLNRMKGLNVVGDQSQPYRINILFQGLSTSLTGGPLCIFRIAQQLVKMGMAIRIINCSNTRQQSRDIISLLPSYDLGDLTVEWVDFNQINNIKCNSHDLFMGTLYSTAVTAYHTQKKLNDKPFIYMIQDFEPYFFEHGSSAVEAYYTYDLPHLAIYNSWLLEQYFKSMKIGNYSSNFKGPSESMMYFPKYSPNYNLDAIKNKKHKRLIVYARDHAHRNAYAFTVSCIWKAVEMGLFEDWEIFGVGGHDGMNHISNLGNKQMTMYNVNHMPYDQYIKFIQSGDIGLSIMTTPHPSLPPFDFVSCGMLVVTNSMHLREPEDYTKISHNFFVGKTNIDAIVEQLQLAVKKVDDYDFRVAGTTLTNIPACSVNYQKINQLLNS